MADVLNFYDKKDQMTNPSGNIAPFFTTMIPSLMV